MRNPFDDLPYIPPEVIVAEARAEHERKLKYRVAPNVDQDLYQRKPFESKAKLKKRQGKKIPRSKRRK